MKQPEALRLADVLERSVNNPHRYWHGEAATELRRLHEVSTEQHKVLEQARDDMISLRAMMGHPNNIRIAEKFVKRLESEIQKLDTRDVPLQVAEGKCWCDEEDVGKPGVSCGDCPKDYEVPVQEPLTDAEIDQCMKEAYATVQGRALEHAFARAIEAKIKEQPWIKTKSKSWRSRPAEFPMSTDTYPENLLSRSRGRH